MDGNRDAIDEPWENEPIMNLSDLERLLRGKAEQLLEEEVRMPDIPLADTSWQPEGYFVRWVLTGRDRFMSSWQRQKKKAMNCFTPSGNFKSIGLSFGLNLSKFKPVRSA